MKQVWEVWKVWKFGKGCGVGYESFLRKGVESWAGIWYNTRIDDEVPLEQDVQFCWARRGRALCSRSLHSW